MMIALPREETGWRPKRVLITRAARSWEHGLAIAERAGAAGIEVVELASDRLQLDGPDDPRAAYTAAKSTLAVVVAPASKRKLQPIAPSADFRVDLAEGCPAHCSYCYLAGSLKGPPITRVYANLPEIIAELPAYVGKGQVTSRSRKRAHEGTTFEASCYTDPLAIEPWTRSLSTLVAHFGAWDADVQLRFTSKFDDVGPLLGLEHQRRTRMRFSINPAELAHLEAGTATVAARLRALGRMVDAGYRVGLTVAPIMAVEGWREAYGKLLRDVAEVLGDRAPDLTVELITHRFTASSKVVLQGWYPRSRLDLSEDRRVEKTTRFGAVKHVYDKVTMDDVRSFFERTLAETLPTARLLYFT
jgi:spore photoproduct lyase